MLPVISVRCVVVMQGGQAARIKQLEHEIEFYKQENTLLKEHNHSLRTTLKRLETHIGHSLPPESEQGANPPQHMLYVPVQFYHAKSTKRKHRHQRSQAK